MRLWMRTTCYLLLERATLERRLNNGGGQIGWSRARVVNYRERLH
jgi:hypothetical protein